ncbi:MAG: GTPase HflX [Ruminococcus bicirculans (ex Wegman et al. 2014)]|uniref:GTPase HflX n=1 Tax=Ruminococcus bicirculans (ex Wegman et al. 2014) TaxID=1160721 RepID=UPI0039A1D039
MFDNTIKKDRVLLAAVDTGSYDVELSLDELEELTETAGGEVIARVTQKRPSFDSGTCIGSGRLEEMAEICRNENIDRIVFDCELTATQIRNIEDVCGVFTIDRTMLILDIFAQRATTREGRLQVEIAQNKYRLPRLAGMGTNMSRLGGGIGTRGPGESKLETDKRHIRTRIAALSDELKEIEKRRGLMRKRRKKDGVLTAAIVGYTNVGKSTLLNYLTEAGVLAENKLFATLETTSRAIELPDGRSVTLIDTVGLIRRLPHQLVEAFKSTLEEAASADVIIHVCDASADDCEEQAKVTLELLKELGCEGIPVVTVFNKCDKVPYINELDTSGEAVKISAKNGTGIDSLLAAIQKALHENSVRCRLLLPFDKAGLVNTIRQEGRIFSEDYTAEGIVLDALVDIKVYHLVESYKVKSEE